MHALTLAIDEVDLGVAGLDGPNLEARLHETSRRGDGLGGWDFIPVRRERAAILYGGGAVPSLHVEASFFCFVLFSPSTHMVDVVHLAWTGLAHLPPAHVVLQPHFASRPKVVASLALLRAVRVSTDRVGHVTWARNSISRVNSWI